MQERFTVYIDESGEAGIGKIRSPSGKGASQYMTLGAALVPNRSKRAIKDTLEKLASELKKPSLHCSQLNHYQIVHAIRSIRRHRMRLFGVISNKATLGTYKRDISSDSSMYYNKCAQYLLERVAHFMESREIPKENLEIVFEKANIDYDKMRNLLWSCQSSPNHPNTKRLKHIDVLNIVERKKKDEPLLQIADLVAHSLYKCVDRQSRNFEITEPRYVRELASNFFGNPKTNKVIGGRLYCVHSVGDLNVDPEVERALKSLVADPPH